MFCLFIYTHFDQKIANLFITFIQYFQTTSNYINQMFSYSGRTLKRHLKFHHPLLAYKILNSFNLPELFYKTLANFLVNRTIDIKINGICSDPFSPESGVPHRVFIGLLLYLLFINDALSLT